MQTLFIRPFWLLHNVGDCMNFFMTSFLSTMNQVCCVLNDTRRGWLKVVRHALVNVSQRFGLWQKQLIPNGPPNRITALNFQWFCSNQLSPQPCFCCSKWCWPELYHVGRLAHEDETRLCWLSRFCYQDYRLDWWNTHKHVPLKASLEVKLQSLIRYDEEIEGLIHADVDALTTDVDEANEYKANIFQAITKINDILTSVNTGGPSPAVTVPLPAGSTSVATARLPNQWANSLSRH